MNTTHRTSLVWLVVPLACVALLLVSVARCPAAGFLDQLSETAKKIGGDIAEGAGKIGEEVSTGARKIGEDVGVLEKKPVVAPAPSQQPKEQQQGVATTTELAATAAKLPGGVTSRLKKMTAELDKAEQAFAANGGKSSNRTYNALENARILKEEMEKGYAGQFSADHPEVAPVYQRYQTLMMTMQGAETDVAQNAGHKSNGGTPAAASGSCDEWNDRLKVFTQGERALHVYPTEEAAQMERWKAAFDDSTALLAQYHATSFDQQSCPQAEGTIRQLTNYRDNFQAIYENYTQQAAQAAASLGQIVFAATPIDPAAPAGLRNHFQAGDSIYGLIQATQPWSTIYKNDQEAQIRVDVTIDGAKIHAQFVTVRDPAVLAGSSLIFDVAPAPDHMTAYRDPTLEYGKSTATMRQGPNELTHHLGQLPPGSHTLRFSVQYYGTTYADGQFTVEGNSFDAYAALHDAIAAGVAGAVTLPQPQLINNALVAEMEKLLQNGGWPAIHRINIVDKDWWIDRVSGGDSPVASRHIAAAALAKGSDGYFYKICTFHQDRLITGGFGPLYLSHQGDPVPVPQENIDK